MDINDYENDKKKYAALKTTLTNIVAKLGTVKIETDNVKTSTFKEYNIDNDYTPLIRRLVNVSKETNEIRNYILTVIIPAIDNAVRNCNTQINKIKDDQAKAKAAAEKAAKAAKAASNKTAKNNGSKNSQNNSSNTGNNNNLRLTRSC